jgi:cytidylate kinase
VTTPLRYARAAVASPAHLSHSITITSETGVGASTTIKALQQRLGPNLWRFVSAGAIMRGFAADLGLTIEEFAEYNRENPTDRYDEDCDAAMAAYAKQNHTMLEGRLPHVFAPHSYRVLLVCPLPVRADRRHADEPAASLTQVMERIRKRDEDDHARYQKLYPGYFWPHQDFDLVLDTSVLTPAEVADEILSGNRKWQKKVHASPAVAFG